LTGRPEKGLQESTSWQSLLFLLYIDTLIQACGGWGWNMPQKSQRGSLPFYRLGKVCNKNKNIRASAYSSPWLLLQSPTPIIAPFTPL